MSGQIYDAFFVTYLRERERERLQKTRLSSMSRATIKGVTSWNQTPNYFQNKMSLLKLLEYVL